MLLAAALVLGALLPGLSAVLADAPEPGLVGNPEAKSLESDQDWSACLDCHILENAGLPQLSTFRPASFAVPIASCEDCHEPIELSGPRIDWTHPVRSIAAHLNCTDCHVAAPHDAADPPPTPYGDYDQEGCLRCHRDISASLSSLWSHGSDPRVRCRDCHPAHEPLRAALPLDLLPSAVREGWQYIGDWYHENAACLACHAPANLIFPLDGGFVTLNTTNYHQLHLDNAQLFCVECHDPHGSRHLGMIRDSLLDGSLLNFTEMIDGGSCAVVCHGVSHEGWRYINKVF